MVLEAGALASHFVLVGIDGREYALPGSPSGEPVLLVFFKTTCSTCDLAFPYVNRLREAYPEGWQLWAVAQDPPDAAARYAERHRITYPVLIDAPAYQVSRLYDPPATPTFFLVGADGRIVFTSHGFAKDDLNEMSRLIAGHLAMEPQVAAPPGDGKPDFRPG